MAFSQTLALLSITLAAAIVNGALGYGFSSITVPIALLFLSNRVLNPALVLVEVVLNGYVIVTNRAAVPLVFPRVLPVLVGLMPGVIGGTIIISQVSPGWLKLATYIVLLPLILFQAAGWRRPIRAERAAGLVFGGGLGVLYSVTTISGPPLAVALNNQGFSKQEFRAALGLIRFTESCMTAIAYLAAGLFTAASLALVPGFLASVLIGVPIGAFVIRHVRSETFRRVCMSFDASIVSFGISTLLRDLHVIEGYGAYSVMAAVIVIDAVLLFRFFKRPPS